MKTFIIFQNSLREINEDLNRLGWTKAEEKYTKVRTHLACSFKGAAGFRAEMFSDYEVVAEIKATDMEDAFAISNLGVRENQVTRFRKMHSLSVGDIVLDENGHFYMVNGMGFGRLLFLLGEINVTSKTEKPIEWLKVMS